MEEHQQEEKPRWMLELENRKRKPRLAHEAGAGAPCLTCESACPGLDLHFWRKICKNCKCRGDNHDVDDDEFPQFELLFGPNARNKKNRAVVLKVNDVKAQSESQFEWIPPNVTKELAADYMNALPSDKLPIKGSVGAALRRQQLQKQLPLHDIDHKACDELSEQERKEFEKYLENLKSCAGQGKVTKLTTIRPFDKSLMTPANATDVQQLSPQHSQQLLNPRGNLNLRTPSSFIPKGMQQKFDSFNHNIPQNVTAPVLPDIDVLKVSHSKATNDNTKFGQYHHTLANVSNSSSVVQGNNVPGTYHLAGNHQTPAQQNTDIVKVPHATATSDVNAKFGQYHHVLTNVPNSGHLAKGNNVPGMYHSGINQTTNLDNKGIATSRDEQKYNEGRLSSKCENANVQPTKVLPQFQNYSHNPSMSMSEEVQKNVKQSTASGNKNNHLDRESNLNDLPSHPGVSQSGYVQTEMNRFLPITSNIIHSETLNNPIFPESTVGASLVNQNPDDINLLQEQMEGVTMNVNKIHQCSECKTDIHCGDVVVTVEKIKDEVWHPGCFVCSACNELLADLVYFTHKGKLYCGRDFAELLKIPRCYACDELIFVREYTVAEGHSYHVKHFCCWDCDIPLAEQQYLPENDRPVCLPCYQKNYAQTCHACHKIIAADQQGVAIKDLHFHVTEDCFCCFMCKKSLLGGKISVKENKLICSKECLIQFTQQKAFDR